MIRSRCLYNVDPGVKFSPQKANQVSPPNPALDHTHTPTTLPPGDYLRTSGGRIEVKNSVYFETVKLKDGRKFYLPYYSFVLVHESDD